jgi:hypothetical protein
MELRSSGDIERARVRPTQLEVATSLVNERVEDQSTQNWAVEALDWFCSNCCDYDRPPAIRHVRHETSMSETRGTALLSAEYARQRQGERV